MLCIEAGTRLDRAQQLHRQRRWEHSICDTKASNSLTSALFWQGPAAEAAAAVPASRHPELFKAMAAGVGQDSTALISPSWPHALRLLQVGFQMRFSW